MLTLRFMAYSITSLESIAWDMIQILQSLVSTFGFEVSIELNPHPDLLARSDDWLMHLRNLLNVTHLQVCADQGPGNYYTTNAYGRHLAALPEFSETGFAVLRSNELRRISEDDIRELISSYRDLPWVPPGDWAKKISRGRGRRKRRS